MNVITIKKVTLINSKNKIFFLVLVLSCLLSNQALPQCGISNGLPVLEFNTQSDLNEFESSSNSDSLMFNLWINEKPELEDTIIEISSLNMITYIGGTFCVINSEKIKDFNQLNNLVKIEGPIKLQYNKSLESLQGFENLSYVGSDISISDNEIFSSFSGTENIDTINGSLQISDCKKLKIIDGFDNLMSLERIDINRCDSLSQFSTFLDGINFLKSISIQESPLEDLNFLNEEINVTEYIDFKRLNISEIKGFNNVENLTSNLRIEDNFFLTEINAFHNLTTVENLFLGRAFEVTIAPQSFSKLDSVFRSLTIRNIQLNDLDFFNSLEYVGFNLNVQNSGLIANLDIFENIATKPEDVIIENNESLDDCSAICDRIRLGLHTTLDNNPGCNTLQELLEICGPSSSASIYLRNTIVFPNPVEDFLHIQNKRLNTSVAIYNLSGKKVINAKNTEIIDVSSLVSGIYIIVINDGERQLIQKIHKI